MSDEADLPGGGGEQRELLARLRAVVEAKDTEITVLRAELAAEREVRRRLELRVQDWNASSGWKAAIPDGQSGADRAKAAPGRAEERATRRGGQDRTGRGARAPRRRPVPGPTRAAEDGGPPAGFPGAGEPGRVTAVGSSWAQVWDVKISGEVTECLLASCRARALARSPPPMRRPARAGAHCLRAGG